MPSLALRNWDTVRIPVLDEIEQAHRRIGGAGRGRRYRMQQINYAYALLLCAHFQGFCRDLHSECVTFLVDKVSPPAIPSAGPILRTAFVQNRLLDSGNANAGNIGSDFKRFGIKIIEKTKNRNRYNERRLRHLQDLNDWRNMIAHENFVQGASRGLTLEKVKVWRSACESLVKEFDIVMADVLDDIVGTRPW